jgi:hypothetical protein
LRKFLEEEKAFLLNQINNSDPEIQKRLKEVFGSALDSAFEDLEKNGIRPDGQERFWQQLSQRLLDCGCFQYGYRYFQNEADAAYTALENQFRCWPPQEDPEWRENADYVWVRPGNSENRFKRFAVILPAGPQELREFLRENDMDSPQKYYIVDMHLADDSKMEQEETLTGWQDIMSLNYFFYRYGQLSEEEKKIFVLAAKAKNIETEEGLINLTANLDGLCVEDYIGSKAGLGKLLVKNKYVYFTFDDSTLPFLDYEKIAEGYMEHWNGMICCGMYIEDTVPQEERIEIYDGVNLPDFTLEQEEKLEESREESPKETPGFGGMTL